MSPKVVHLVDFLPVEFSFSYHPQFFLLFFLKSPQSPCTLWVWVDACICVSCWMDLSEDSRCLLYTSDADDDSGTVYLTVVAV